MSFLIHSSVISFLEAIATGSAVYSLAFTEISAEKPEAVVLLTAK